MPMPPETTTMCNLQPGTIGWDACHAPDCPLAALLAAQPEEKR